MYSGEIPALRLCTLCNAATLCQLISAAPLSVAGDASNENIQVQISEY
jgi:hypothetical protein